MNNEVVDHSFVISEASWQARLEGVKEQIRQEMAKFAKINHFQMYGYGPRTFFNNFTAYVALDHFGCFPQEYLKTQIFADDELASAKLKTQTGEEFGQELINSIKEAGYTQQQLQQDYQAITRNPAIVDKHLRRGFYEEKIFDIYAIMRAKGYSHHDLGGAELIDDND